MTKVAIDPGQCDNKAEICVTILEDGLCSIKVLSECLQIQQLALRVSIVNPEDELNQGSSCILAQARRCCHHTFCSIPSALIRAVQIESGMNLSGDINMSFEHT